MAKLQWKTLKTVLKTDGNFLLIRLWVENHGKIKFVSENNIKFARMAGNVTTENNGGFIQFRAELSYKLKDESNGITYCQRNQDYFVYKNKWLCFTVAILWKNFSN